MKVKLLDPMPNSIEENAAGDWDMMERINKGRREADVDLALMETWARSGFVSGAEQVKEFTLTHDQEAV